ncbi:hypothetical protein SJ05684_c03720 [Sinorhizobium sojae CCBAU 05684]|uniref:YjiS-like domain-containing protein n=1 Tax=Sinorhizobium sojae CCBAU 05684 TaxID=716928 RepID=A0A249P7D7_9HYPH|nr:DUF1127 domain-containing protein [Sinorhizobium sojae]ASY61838.1 hypothetical protein SJ05684_c03720 [Sinorhizobium sojae CCBAU 05684]
MRTTEHALDLVAGKPTLVSRAAGIVGVLTAVWRQHRSRRQIARLHDLDDRQLLDMGLKRQDLNEALTSAFFEDPSSYLTRASRNRANLFYRGMRHD